MEITSSVITDFRGYYPEFSDSAMWPDDTLTRYLQDGEQETGSRRWGAYGIDPATFKARGLFAAAAHFAVLGKMAEQATANGQVPTGVAQITSRTVGDESLSYATPQVTGHDSTAMQATAYGQEFLRLRRRAGAGAAVP